jgi:hypothetical protein
MVFLVIYGFFTNIYDMKIRPDFWLDNRPIVYDFWYRNLITHKKESGQKVFISTLIGDSQRYCRYYLRSDCDLKNIKFASFDISSGVIESGIYLGFEGEFVGPQVKNEFVGDWKKKIADKGLVMVESSYVRDTVAFRYGNNIGLVIKQ